MEKRCELHLGVSYARCVVASESYVELKVLLRGDPTFVTHHVRWAEHLVVCVRRHPLPVASKLYDFL
jgi:hypothetical protein